MAEIPEDSDVEVNDEALGLAVGGIILSKNPTTTMNNSTYSTNSTIYFQSSVWVNRSTNQSQPLKREMSDQEKELSDEALELAVGGALASFQITKPVNTTLT